jgi:exopolysaccharide biosynthesis operon protein EpsL
MSGEELTGRRQALVQHRFLSVALLAAALSPLPAFANKDDTLNVVLSTSIVYDSNLFRVPDSFALPASVGTSRKSDLVAVSSVGLKIDKPYAQQRFQLDLSGTTYNYENFSFLDFDALEYRGRWLWHLTPRINGTLYAARTKRPVPFQDVRVFEQAIRTADDRLFNMDAWLAGPWHLLLGASEVSVKDSRNVTAEPSYEASGGHAGVKFLSRAGNWISVVQKRLDGEYQESRLDLVNLFDNAFTEDHTEVRLLWSPTGKSTISGHVGWFRREHDNVPQRDFDGFTGDLSYTWTPTGKLRFTTGVARTLGAYWDDLASSYRATNTAAAGARWVTTAHTEFGATVSYATVDYEGALSAHPRAGRRDKLLSARTYVSWKPRRFITVEGRLEHHTRSSNIPDADFDATVAGVSVALTF